MSDLAERLRAFRDDCSEIATLYGWDLALLIEAAAHIAAEPTRIRAAVEAERDRAAAVGAIRIVEKMIPLTGMTTVQLAELLAAGNVCIRSDNGWWREARAGYTNNIATAGLYTGTDAYDATRQCGPEKSVQYAILNSTIRRGE